MGLDACPALHLQGNRREGLMTAVVVRDDIEIIEEGEAVVVGIEVLAGGMQGVVLCQCVEGRHQWVALLSTFPLHNVMCGAQVVGPEEMRLALIPHMDIGDERVQ